MSERAPFVILADVEDIIETDLELWRRGIDAYWTFHRFMHFAIDPPSPAHQTTLAALLREPDERGYNLDRIPHSRRPSADAMLIYNLPPR